MTLLEAGEIGRRHRRDEIDIAGEQRRDPRRRLLDRGEDDLVDIAGRVLVPILGEALELQANPLLAFGDDEGPGAARMGRGEGGAMLDDRFLGAPALVDPE